ncbi:MAG: efflux RND transporter periplasmic adaptor subunit, partial [Phycisphaerae bacterium]|nr:efflux RND transporter periplasmic adaptor subunit [Phycisphaerae bacterium]
VPGRLERLFVDYTGVPVRKGDPLVSLFSPALLSAQQELLQAILIADRLGTGGVEIVRQTTTATIDAAREKLQLWGLTKQQVDEIEQNGKPSDHITIAAPSGGIVIHKHVREGMYVQTGTPIYTIADLSQVWVRLEAYESDLPWLRYGQPVTFTAEAYPGESTTGTVAFIDPVVDEQSRTVRVRVNVPNPSLKLKPGMFVRGTLEAKVAEGGKVLSTSLAGKWICPMHPEVVGGEPGQCDRCGMPLVPATDLGYAGEPDAAPPLLVPASAVLLTGSRAVVYVAVAGRDRPTYAGREILVGPRAGDWYIALKGLKEGEEVVVNGSFMLDAELQIRAQPSMMMPQDPEPDGMSHENSAMKAVMISDGFRDQLQPVIEEYLAVQTALTADDLTAAAKAAGRMSEALGRASPAALDEEARSLWERQARELALSLDVLLTADALQSQRECFAALSSVMIRTLQWFEPDQPAIFRFHCPMAFNGRGADWLQTDPETAANPYFGAVMLTCGERVEDSRFDDRTE